MKEVFRNVLPSYLEHKECLNLGLTCKEYYSLLKPQIIKKIKDKQKYIKDKFSSNIIDMIGKQNFLNGELIEWQDKWLGHTDYIDRIRFSDLSDNKFHYGVDRYQRSFIFAKIHDKQTVFSIFQRYINGSIFVIVEPSGKMSDFLGGQVAINEEMHIKLKNLFFNNFKN